jgi:hypothetical protein
MNRTTRFKPTPEGVKTAKMLEVEARIGRSLEEDYTQFYFNNHVRGHGQKALANRWGIARNQTFGQLRGGRRNWVQMLGLPSKGEAVLKYQPRRRACEICGVHDTPIEAAHWIPARDGGSTRADNTLKLCPNCHQRLDRQEDPATIRRAREILLLRAAEAYLRSTTSRDESVQRQFVGLCSRIIQRRHQD